MRLRIANLLIIGLLLNKAAFACNSAQLIDYDYQARETLGNSYATFGRLWALDGQEVCGTPKKYTACLTITPKTAGTELKVRMVKNNLEQTVYSQELLYNRDEVVSFSFNGVNVYLKLYVSNTIADYKMSGKSCQEGFPNMPRQITKSELNTMYRK